MAQQNEHIVRSYMEKVLALRRERKQERLREEELEEIALQAGLARNAKGKTKKRRRKPASQENHRTPIFSCIDFPHPQRMS